MERLVVIGTSLGGVAALEAVIGGLDARFPVPIAVVQHRGVDDGRASYTSSLQARSSLQVVEADDKMPILPGRVYVAPADYHLLVDGGHFALSTEARVRHARPSIDVLFESAADEFRSRLVAVVLTGTSADGTAGVMKVKRRGGTVVVQDPTTAEGALMPRSAIAATTVDRVLPLSEIPGYLTVWCHARVA